MPGRRRRRAATSQAGRRSPASRPRARRPAAARAGRSSDRAPGGAACQGRRNGQGTRKEAGTRCSSKVWGATNGRVRGARCASDWCGAVSGAGAKLRGGSPPRTNARLTLESAEQVACAHHQAPECTGRAPMTPHLPYPSRPWTDTTWSSSARRGRRVRGLRGSRAWRLGGDHRTRPVRRRLPVLAVHAIQGAPACGRGPSRWRVPVVEGIGLP